MLRQDDRAIKGSELGRRWLHNIDYETRQAAGNRALLRHSYLNAGVPKGRIRVRKGIEFAVADSSTIDPFCFVVIEGIEEMDCFIRNMQGKQRLLDIGGLHGVFSLVFTSRPGTEALAMEPSPQALPTLHRNVEMNPTQKIDVLERAASSRNGYLEMAYEWIYIVARKSPKTPGEKLHTIKCVRVDDLNYEPDMIKIDVEGHELQVLMGMEKLLKNKGPDIHLEIHGQFLNEQMDSAYEIFEFLQEDMGYKIFDMFDNPQTFEDVMEKETCFHVFATKGVPCRTL